jgi:methylmalonyl-CoA mutase C-terminal domain
MHSNKLRIMIAQIGPDMHDRGARRARLIARSLREAGYEVWYAGYWHTPEEIVDIVINKNIDLLGLICLSGAHSLLFPAISRGLREKGAEHIRIFGDGTIPLWDFAYLHDHRIQAVFPGDSPLASILDWVEQEAGATPSSGSSQRLS